MQFLKTALLSTAFAVFAAGCASTPKPPAAAPAPMAAAPQAPAPAAPAASAAPAPMSAMKTLPAYLDPANALSQKKSVYFDFDNYEIKKDYAALLEMHAKFLVANPGVSIKVEGNADERGGAEYNLALGQKRADAVTKALLLYGVNAKQVESISWGKEKPKATGHDEAAWAQNRRGDLVYPAQ